MPSVKLSPIGNDQVVTTAGAPAVGWYWSTFAAGSSTPQTTYTSAAGTVPQAAQIVLNADGVPDSPIWLVAGLAYKFVLYDSSDVSQRTIDNVVGINDTSVSIAQWLSSGVTPTYISASQFSLVGDQTSEFHVGRRVQCTVTAGTVYGAITASAYTTLTTVTVALDSGSLDSGLSAVNLSLLRADNPALPKSSAVLESMGAAPLASPAFTGVPTAPTASQGTSTTQVATTAFVLAAAPPIGTVIHSISSTAPAGWLKANGLTIGSASSGATGLASADAAALFAVIWNSTNNTDFPVYTSGGVGTTRGASAADDFAANKRIAVPDLRGEFVRGLDDSRGVDSSRTMGSAQLDAMQGHQHSAFNVSGGAVAGGGAIGTPGNSGNPITDGVNGTPRTAAETRPRNIALMAYIRYL